MDVFRYYNDYICYEYATSGDSHKTCLEHGHYVVYKMWQTGHVQA